MEFYKDWTDYIECYCRDFCILTVECRRKGQYMVLYSGTTRAVLSFESRSRQWLTAVTLYSTLSRFKVNHRPRRGITFNALGMDSVERFLNIAFLTGWCERWHYVGDKLVLREAYGMIRGGDDRPFYSEWSGGGMIRKLQTALGIRGRVKEYRFFGALSELGEKNT